MEKNHRRCVSCRQTAPKITLWRLIRLAGTQTIVLDVGMGRSAYLCPNASCLQSAQKKDRLSRALKTRVDPHFYQQLADRLTASEPD
jgi:uncharacterized protein